ncbi:hypothetical protein [Actinocorallia lasiicapitis]
MAFPGRSGKAVWAVLAAVVVGAVVVAGLLLDRDGSESPQGKGGDAVQAANQEDTSPPTAEPIPPDTVPSEKPTVTPQAKGLKEKKLPSTAPGAGPESTASVPANFDGCDHNYGDTGQCVPWVFPDGIEEYADKCLWLKLNGFRDVKVRGADRQKLDLDGNKIACDQ